MNDWREHYETAADAEEASLQTMSDADILEAIRNGQTGNYYTIWRTVGASKPNPAICWTLYEALLDQRPYLDRFHCAEALIRILCISEFQAVDLSALRPTLQDNLARLSVLIERAVGRL